METEAKAPAISGRMMLDQHRKLFGSSAPVPAKIVRAIIRDYESDLKIWSMYDRAIQATVRKFAP